MDNDEKTVLVGSVLSYTEAFKDSVPDDEMGFSVYRSKDDYINGAAYTRVFLSLNAEFCVRDVFHNPETDTMILWLEIFGDYDNAPYYMHATEDETISSLASGMLEYVEKNKEDHEGMIYNEYTGKWGWL